MRKQQLDFLKEIDFKIIHEHSILNTDIYLRHDSTIQRLIVKFLDDECTLTNLNSNNIIKYASLLEGIHYAIYEKYHSKTKNNSDIPSSNISETFGKLEGKASQKYDKGWDFSSYNNTVRKFGEKLFPIQGKYFFEPIYTYSEKEKRKVILLIENTKSVRETEDSSKNNHFWMIGNSFQSEGFSNRIYFNVSANLTYLELFLDDIQNWLNFRNIPFKLKFPKNNEDFKELTDNTVLYFQRENTLQVFEVLKRIELKYGSINLFDSGTPLFTKELFTGVSFGESPDNEVFTSFGSYRSAILAILIVDKLIKNNFTNYEINISELQKEISSLDLFNVENYKHLGLGKTWLDHFYTNQFSGNDYSSHFNHFDKFLPETEISFNSGTFLFGAYKVATILWNEAYFFPKIEEKNNSLYTNWIHCQNNLIDEKGLFGYQYESMDNTFENGVSGVIYFLIQFNEIYPTQFNSTILSCVISNFVLNGGTNIFVSNNKLKSKSDFNPDIKFELKIDRFNSSPVLDLIDKVVFTDYKLNKQESELSFQILNDINNDKVFENFNDNSEPNFSLGYGYSLLGYFFLRLHSPIEFPKIIAEINIVKPNSTLEVSDPPSYD